MAHHGRDPRDIPPEMAEAMRKLWRGRDVGPFNMDREETLRKTLLDAPDDEARMATLRRALLDSTNMVGATGQFPQGKLNATDEGGIQFRIGSEGNKVVLDFGSPVAWVGMDAQQAADMASSLMKWARIVGRKNGQTITVNLGAV